METKELKRRVAVNRRLESESLVRRLNMGPVWHLGIVSEGWMSQGWAVEGSGKRKEIGCGLVSGELC